MFKLNWLITSKSGFSEPNWHTNVISLTPSTLDSFIGVNLLKNYYKYVKYDFVSYKLFTRQLQLIQICAIILTLVHRVLIYYKEFITMSSISNNFGNLNTSSQALMSDSTMVREIFYRNKTPYLVSGTTLVPFNSLQMMPENFW